MDGARFDRLARALGVIASRRGLLTGLSAFGFSVIPLPGAVGAKKKRKKKPKPNKYGCLDAGQPCRGNDNKCCSGICEGKKPKKGKRDKSQCVAHNVGGCQPGQDWCAGMTVVCGPLGTCFRTTGKASVCGGFPTCHACSKDKQCEAMFGPGAACVVCPSMCPAEGTMCVSAEA